MNPLEAVEPGKEDPVIDDEEDAVTGRRAMRMPRGDACDISQVPVVLARRGIGSGGGRLTMERGSGSGRSRGGVECCKRPLLKPLLQGWGLFSLPEYGVQ